MPPITPVAGAGVTGAPSSAGSSSAMGRDDFLLLLVAQLRHQDPLNPIQAQDFASQLAQFTAMEQQLRTNELLEAQGRRDELRLGEARESMAVGLLGRVVLTEGDLLQVSGGEPVAAHVRTDGAGGFRVDVLDESGNAVLSLRQAVPAGGVHRIDLGEAGAALPPGRYVVRVEGESGTSARPLTAQMVRGVRFDASGPVVLTEVGELRLSQVLQITHTS